jgi:hypothetical protein
LRTGSNQRAGSLPEWLLAIPLAVAVAGASIAAVRLDDRTTSHQLAAAARLGLVAGGPDRQQAQDVEEQFVSYVNRPAPGCHGLDQLGQNPSFWVGRASVSIFLDSPDPATVRSAEADLDDSPAVAFWIYEPQSAAAKEATQQFGCAIARIPASIRVQLNTTSEATRQALMSRLRVTLPPGSTVNCSTSITCPNLGLPVPPQTG